MRRVLYDRKRALSLDQRRVIAARLCYLVGASIDDHESAPVDWSRFVGDLNARLREVGFREETGLDLTERVAEIREAHARPDASHRVSLALGRIERLSAAAFQCEQCSRHEGGCTGGLKDLLYFEDDGDQDPRPAGLCVGFVRKLVRTALDCAEGLYAPHLDAGALGRLPQQVAVRLAPEDAARDATLPLNGSVEVTDGSAVIEVVWPRAPEEIEDGLLMLPWLVFHEVFVHIFQGLARPTPLGMVPPSCSFTEGLVDALARTELKPNLLDRELPAELVPLRQRFDKATREYGEKRIKPLPEDRHPHRSTTLAAQYRLARSKGAALYDALWGVARRRNRPPSWLSGALMRLNAELSLPQREAFVRNFGELLDDPDKDQPQLLDRPLEDEVVTAFGDYLDRRKTAHELIDRLAKLGESRFNQD